MALIYTLINNNTAYEISKGSSIVGAVTIPSTYNGKPVTSIGNNAFASCNSLTSVVIPDSVTSIGGGAFGWCSSLTSVEIGDSVTSIGSNAFNSCSNLTSVVIPDSVTSIGYYAFENCSSLTSIIIPNSVTSINNGLLGGCTKLESLTAPFVGIDRLGLFFSFESNGINSTVPSTLKTVVVTGGTQLGAKAFANCHNLTNIEIPDSVTTIWQYAFELCTSLESLVLSNNITTLGAEPFKYCNKLKTVKMPANNNIIAYLPFAVSEIEITGGESISDRSFVNRDFSLRKIVIGDSITSIGKEAFLDCTSLKEISFGKNVKSIGDWAFYNCRFTSVEIPKSITSIGKQAFEKCSKLTNVTFEEGSQLTAISAYMFDECGSLTEIKLPDSVTSIGYGAFRSCSNLTSVVIPESVTSIEDETFNGCSNLTSINLHDNMTSVGNSAFYGCSSLTSITIPSSVTSIDDYAFYSCSGLTSITVPDSVTSIGKYTFGACSSLTSITLPFIGNEKTSTEPFGYVFGAGYYAYNNEYIPASLETVIITGGESINPYVFSGCSGLKSITLPDTVTNICYYAFDNCTSLATIEIGSGITSVDTKAFNGCENLKNVNYAGTVNDWAQISFTEPTSNPLYYGAALYLNNELLTSADIDITKINNYVFYNYSSLTSVVIGNSVTEIGNSAFYGCASLTSVYITNIEAWCNISFSNKEANPLSNKASIYLNNQPITELIIPNTLTQLKDYAFFNCQSVTSIIIPSSIVSINNFVFDKCDNLTIAYYEGDIGEWQNIYINANNASLRAATLYYYIEKENIADIPATDGGNYWYYDENGKITILLLEASKNLEYKLSSDSTYYTLIGLGSCTDTDIKVPSTYNGISVTAVNKQAFLDKSELTSIVIPDSVTSIGDYAFQGCSKLTSIVVGRNVAELGYDILKGCTRLQSLSIPFIFSSYYVSSTGTLANILFDVSSVTSLKKLTITGGQDNKITNADNTDQYTSHSLFSGFPYLSSIQISGITSVQRDAFADCKNLAKIVITDIEEWLNITFGNKTAHPFNSKGKNTCHYYLNDSLITKIVIPDSITKVNQFAFYNCSDLKVLETHGKVTSIGSSAFYNCVNLTDITIGDSINKVSDTAFYGCDSLKNVDIHSVATVGSEAFYSENNTLDSLSVLADAKFGSNIVKHCANLNVYLTNLASWFNTSKSLFIDVRKLATNIHLYFNNELLTEFNVPDSITEITKRRGNTFYGADPDIFENCISLTAVNIPSSVTIIDQGAFRGCSNLVSMTVPFTGCYSDSLINFGYIFGQNEFPNSYKANDKFYIPNSLRSVTVLGGDIQGTAFAGCSSLTNVVLPNNLGVSIGSQAFLNCSNLESITIPANVKYISSEAFSGCAALKTVIFNSRNTLYSLDDKAFYGCANLSGTIELPYSLRIIGKQAFDLGEDVTGINKLDIIIPGGMSTVDANAFGNFTNLTLYSRTASAKAGWNNSWNYLEHPVIWCYEWDKMARCTMDLENTFDQEISARRLSDRNIAFDWQLSYDRWPEYKLTPVILDFIINKDTEYEHSVSFKSSSDIKKYLTNIDDVWQYRLPTSSIDLAKLAKARTPDGWITITTATTIKDDYGAVYTISNNFKTEAGGTTVDGCYLELPPVMPEPEAPATSVIQTALNKSKPGEYVCSWLHASELDGSNDASSPDDLDGYCIELHRYHEDSDEYERLGGLALAVETKRTENGTENVYKLIRTSDTESNYEVYMDFYNTDNVALGVATEPKFYFEPVETNFNIGRALKLNRGDKYKFVIYPYSHYGEYYLAGAGADSDLNEVSKGVVRIKTDNSWVEGQVWVCINDTTEETSDKPKWVAAEVLYVATAGEDGKISWKEAQ